jgi:hypothetical protein
LLRFETKFLLARTPDGEAEWALGLKMPRERESEWRKQLGELARASGLQVKEGAEWTAARDKYRLALKREGDWTLVRGGYFAAGGESKMLGEFRTELRKLKAQEVLAAELNFPELGDLWKAPRLSHAPRMVIESTPNGDGFRSEVKLHYSHDLGIKPEKWNVPASLFREPLVGFTAVQGVGKALAASPHVQAMAPAKVPNQLFAWSVGDPPFSTYVAADVGNARDVLNNIIEKVIPEIRRRAGPVLTGEPQVSSNRTRVAWRGALPVAVPFAQVGREPDSNYLMLGLFPVASGNSNSAPSELFNQLKKKNLIYYEWEITEGRLTQWRPIWQIAQMTSPQKVLRTESASVRWLAAITPKLGNTITEAVLENDREIRVVRQSHLGFNALELVLFAHWADPNDVRMLGDGRRISPAEPANGAKKNAETRR